MDSRELRDWIHAAFEVEEVRGGGLPDHLTERVARVLTLQDANIFTALDGLVVAMASGDEFQVVVTQTRHAPGWEPADARHG